MPAWAGHQANMKSLHYLVYLTAFLLLAACSPSEKSVTADQAKVDYDLIYALPEESVSFNDQVKPILEGRCIVCHGCYDAPCQLKLTSTAGIKRGSSKEIVYNGERITAADPTRLFIDAITTEQWRQKDFTPVLNENMEVNNPVENLENSVLYHMLRLKQVHPQARTGMLSDAFDISLSREQTCPTLEEFDQYKTDHPEGGMPYAMPNLKRTEYNTLVHWLAQGAPMPEDEQPSEKASKQINKWETFLNGDSKKQQLVSRYLYEHLFQARLNFEGTEKREFYRLVRSTTQPGAGVEVIPTRRPYGNPEGPVYYRIVRHQGSIVAKDHMVYQLSDARMERFRELFYKPDYEVTVLPSYEPAVASNPIKTFAQLPVKSRYKFMLDEARFFIEGFIKGPVCRGQIALNVIEDQFWVVFFDPEAPIMTSDDDFLNSMSDYLASPTEREDTYRLLVTRTHYKSLFRKYVEAKEKNVKDFKPVDLQQAMSYIWDGSGQGDKKNPNAALTIFRHLDSASVNFGWIGDYPETAWVIDYSVLERIHYLLVAGFDVYGNVGHQLNTRLYMDFLRTEGEDYFLAFLPADKRGEIRDSWYKGIRVHNKGDEGDITWVNQEIVTGYQSDNPQRELFRTIEHHLGDIAGDGDFINRCHDGECARNKDKTGFRADRAMRKAVRMEGRIIQFLPDVAFVRVRMGGKPEDDLAYTMIANKAYKSVSSILESETLVDRRDYEFDTQTIVRWLEGSYPNFFYVVDIDDIDRFVDEYYAIQNRDEYEMFVARYGIRRTNEEFWQYADWFNQQYRREKPMLSGIFDLNRYQNR